MTRTRTEKGTNGWNEREREKKRRREKERGRERETNGDQSVHQLIGKSGFLKYFSHGLSLFNY